MSLPRCRSLLAGFVKAHNLRPHTNVILGLADYPSICKLLSSMFKHVAQGLIRSSDERKQHPGSVYQHGMALFRDCQPLEESCWHHLGTVTFGQWSVYVHVEMGNLQRMCKRTCCR